MNSFVSSFGSGKPVSKYAFSVTGAVPHFGAVARAVVVAEEAGAALTAAAATATSAATTAADRGLNKPFAGLSR